MSPKQEVIAMLMPDGDVSDRLHRTATLLLRGADGQMSLQTVNSDSKLRQYALSTGCFRKGTPIIDPVTRQVVGYEMEMIPSPLTQFA